MLVPDSLQAWTEHYLQMAVVGVRSKEIQKKIALHLKRFRNFFLECYGHERLSVCLKRDVVAWQKHLQEQDFAAATVNNYLASLSAFTTWVHAQEPNFFVMGDPAKGISELPLAPLEPRALSEQQIQSLKSICDRLFSYYRLKGTKPAQKTRLRANARPWRDRAIVFVLLSTGLRREELVKLNLEQLSPHIPDKLRQVRRSRIHSVRGKGQTQRDVFLSLDARQALADYLEKEHPLDRVEGLQTEDIPLFLSAVGVVSRSETGRLSPRSINSILCQIGRWHDAEFDDTERHISPLRPHDLRHTFAFQLAKATGADSYELERRLGHRSQRYIQRYTNPPEKVAASYIEDF